MLPIGKLEPSDFFSDGKIKIGIVNNPPSESGYRADITLSTNKDITAFLETVRAMPGIQSVSVRWIAWFQ